MEELALNQLAKIVYDYCGLNYLNNLSSLKMKICKHLQELNIQSVWGYIRFLEENPSEWEYFIELLTVNETYFYREDKQLYVFQNKILQELISSNRPVKIWSAGCSTGEEPYSLAMLTVDSNIEENKIQIIGTDINQRVLRVAKSGIYSKNSLSFRRIPPHWLQTYFHETSTDYEVKDHIKNMVSFHYLNLLDEVANGKNEEFDVIFCRNVLIYFDQETIKKVVTAFYHALKKGGYLFLGHAETISQLDIGFETINTNGTFYYIKR